MSSVNSTKSGSGQDDNVRQMREEYRKKEAELIKRQNNEIRALNERYVGESDRKDQLHSAGLNDLRNKSKEALTQRDLKYRKEMDDMRAMHGKQLEKLMSDNRTTLEAQTKAAKLEVKQANLGKNDRTRELTDEYEKQSAGQQAKFTEQLDYLRAEQRDALEKNRESVMKAHERELDIVRDERNDTVSDLKNESRALRQNANRRLRDQEIHHMQDKMRMSTSHIDNLKRESEAHNNIQDISREGYQEGLRDVRTRMAEAREKDLETGNSIKNSFHADVQDRIDNQVNRLERDVVRARDVNVLEKSKAQMQAKTQVNNMRDTYQKKFDYLEKARLDTLRQSNEINSQNINKVRNEADKILVEGARYNRQTKEIDNLRNKQAIDSMKHEFGLRQGYTEEMADTRIDRIREDAIANEIEMRENFKSNIDLQREATNTEKRDLRLTVEKEKNATTQILKEQAQKQEVTHQRVLADTVAKYEKRISDMNEQFTREKRLRDVREKDLVNNLNRQKQNEIDSLQIQHTDQAKQAQLNHDREVKDISRRTQEKLDEVLRSVKKS